MGCGGSVPATANAYAPVRQKQNLAGLPPGFCDTLKALANDATGESQGPQVLSVILQEEVGKVAQGFENATLNDLELIVRGLVNCLNFVLSGSLQAVQDLVSSKDGEEMSSSQRSVCKQLQENIQKEQLAFESRHNVTQPMSSKTIVQSIITFLRAVRTKKGCPSPTVFHSGPLNYALRIVLAGAWKGDAVAGGRKSNESGVPGWLVNTLLSSLGLLEWESNIDEDNPDIPAIPGPYLVLLDGSTKALLSYQELLGSVAQANGTAQQLHVKLSRNRALHETLQTVDNTVGSVIVMPVFRSANGTVEEGEGHGPRKEFFSVVSERFCSEWGAEELGPCTVSCGDGPATLRANGDLSGRVNKGDRVTLGNDAIDQLTATRRGKPAPTSGVVSGVSQDGVVSLESAIDIKAEEAAFTFASPRKPLLVYKQGMECHWPNSALDQSLELKRHYQLLGWLIGNCGLNRSQLAFRLPPVFFRQLLAKEISPNGAAQDTPGPLSDWDTFTAKVDDLRNLDPSLLAMAQKIAAMSDDDYKAILELEGMPSSTTRDKYIRGVATELVVGSVQWQMDAIRAGFRAALNDNSMSVLKSWETNAEDLCSVVCGVEWGVDEDFDIGHHYRIVCNGGDVKDNPELTNALWEVVESWEPSKKRQFLLFVTGVDKLPSPGSEDLVIELPFVAITRDEHKGIVGMLPQAHTCSNTIELPNYWESICYLDDKDELSVDQRHKKMRELIAQKFTLAIENTAGYGLDDANR